MTAADVGRMGEWIAVQLWPSLRLVPSGSRADREGTDAWDGSTPIQIKTDGGIVDRVFRETWKRTGAWASFGGKSGQWRRSPSTADEYIFVGPVVALRAPVNVIAQAERGRVLTPLRPNGSTQETAMGFLIPLAQLVALGAESRTHVLWACHREPLPGPRQNLAR